MNSKELLLLRHAKSAWDSDAPSDFQRPLNKRGIKMAKNLGEWMNEHVATPLQIISSPALRAWQTATTVAHRMGIAEQQIKFHSELYMASPIQLREVIAQITEDTQRLLVVGHNPGLEELLEYLVDDTLPEIVEGKVLPTATLAVISIEHPWSGLEKACGEIHGTYRFT